MAKHFRLLVEVCTYAGESSKGHVAIECGIPMTYKHGPLVTETYLEALGEARCAPEDVFVAGVGLRIATARLLDDVKTQMTKHGAGWGYPAVKAALVTAVRQKAIEMLGRYPLGLGE